MTMVKKLNTAVIVFSGVELGKIIDIFAYREPERDDILVEILILTDSIEMDERSTTHGTFRVAEFGST